MGAEEHWRGCIQAGWEPSRAFLLLVAPAWPVSSLASPHKWQSPRSAGEELGQHGAGFPGNAYAGKAPTCLCALFGIGGTLECWREEPWAQGSGASEPQQCRGWQEAPGGMAVEGISLLGSHRGSGATAERTGNCWSE